MGSRMRITPFERQAITQTAEEIFGPSTHVYLFGSRVDDSKRGGDIDLYIVCSDISDISDMSDMSKVFEKKIWFLAKLKRAIGDQKIDVVFHQDATRPIEQEAIIWGIHL